MKDAIDTHYKIAKEKILFIMRVIIKNNPSNAYRVESHKILFINYNYVLT